MLLEQLVYDVSSFMSCVNYFFSLLSYLSAAPVVPGLLKEEAEGGAGINKEASRAK